MILLPDIVINISGAENILSLQDPYTLNGKIITDVCFNREPYEENYYTSNVGIGEHITTVRMSLNNSIHIRNEDDYNIVISENDLSQIIHNKLNLFFQERNSNMVEVGEDRRNMWTIRRDYGVSNYIRDLIRQCEQIANSYFLRYNDTGFISKCKVRLRNQGRLLDESREQYSFSSLTGISGSRSHAEGMYSTSVFSNAISNWATIGFSSDTTDSYQTKNKYIHEYNYKPQYIKHYMKDEDESSLLLGAEIEVAGNNRTDLDKNDVVKKCIQIMNGSDDDTENLIYSTSDSTVQIELDTMPCTLNYHKQLNYKELFKYLDELGYKGHDCENAGLHIHADRSYLGKSELKQQLVITKILYILEKFNDEICVIARRNNSYSQFVGKEEVNKTLYKLYSKYNNYGKRVALNLQHKDTIEFRCFRSTLKYETFILTLEFVKNIIDYAKVINIEDIELIQWSDLMNTFSDELKIYYNDRFEKEQKKKKEEKEKRNISIESGSLYFQYPNGEHIAIGSLGTLGLDTITYHDENINNDGDSNGNISAYYNNTTPNEVVRHLSNACSADCSATLSCSFDSISSSLDNLYNTIYRNDNTSSTQDEIESRIDNISKIETKKKEIKNLKKRIKNSNNYMEKTQLNSELAKAQKELKKLKKKNNLNNNTNINDEVLCTVAVADTNRQNRNNTIYNNNYLDRYNNSYLHRWI